MKRTKFKNSMVLLLCVLMLFGHPISTMAQSIPANTDNAVDMQLERPITTPVSRNNASVATDGLIFDFNMDEIKQGTSSNAGNNSEYVINGQPK